MSQYQQQPPSAWGQPQPPQPKQNSTGKKVGIGCLGAFVALFVIGGLGAALSDDDTGGGKPAAQEEPRDKPSAEEEKPAEAEEEKSATEEPATEEEEPAAEESADEAETEVLPDFVGQELQAAQDGAQAAGFYGLTSHDATGLDRFQVLDRNWIVCSQDPAAGEHPTDTVIDFGAVKQSESCP